MIPSFNALIVHLEMPTEMDRLLLFVLSLENFSGGMGTAAFVALLSNLCNVRFSATHYALLSALRHSVGFSLDHLLECWLMLVGGKLSSLYLYWWESQVW